MRYAILSDVHGNLEALSAVLADARDRTDAVLCLGDVVGYGADPAACVDLVADTCERVVAGNHERAVTGQLALDWFNPWARTAAEWTRGQLSRDASAWLAALPLVQDLADATLVHASPASPEEWEYLVSAEDGFAAFGAFLTRVCFVGHSHVPRAWAQGSWGHDHDLRPSTVSLDAGCRYIVNVGSVGQPRDRDPRAAYAVWDLDRRQVEIRRVAYDVAAARTKILRAGLPKTLAERLVEGR